MCVKTREAKNVAVPQKIVNKQRQNQPTKPHQKLNTSLLHEKSQMGKYSGIRNTAKDVTAKCTTQHTTHSSKTVVKAGAGGLRFETMAVR